MDSETRENRYKKDVSDLNIEARCKDIFDLWKGDCYEELETGKSYKVTHIYLTTDFCYVFLEGCSGMYNSVCFTFLDKGKEVDITQDKRCYSEALLSRLGYPIGNS